jgi:hypothetical protein
VVGPFRWMFLDSFSAVTFAQIIQPDTVRDWRTLPRVINSRNPLQ